LKYIVIIGDGMADRPLKELGGKTPLEAASTPNMDRLAREGAVGVVRTIPKGLPPGSDVANLSILGYNPFEFYTGRAPLEAASMGVALKEGDVAYRCNLVTLSHDRDRTRAYMEDYSAGHISSEESRELIKSLNDGLRTDNVAFYAGVSYRHLMVWSGGEHKAECVPPHDITGKEITDYLPVGKGDWFLREMMRNSLDILVRHEVNRKRSSGGKRPANSIWLWGQGLKPDLPKFRDKYGVDGALVSAVDLTKGLGIYAGLKILDVPGVTGYIDTNYIGKAEHSLDALKNVDFVYIHVEAPDEAAHAGNYKDKIKAIEDIDELVVGTVLKGISSFGDCRVLLMPDHATPIEVRTHTDEPVPFVIWESRKKRKSPADAYSEKIVKMDDIVEIEEGYKLMDYFIKGRMA
jgi:2,3-bisphosphoglycerate-independent phosphoglycerate mutase